MASALYKFWRIKLQDYPEGETKVRFYMNRTTVGGTDVLYIGEKKVKVRRNSCDNPEKYIYLKFLDSDGRYKFIQFDRYYTSETTQEKLGTISKLSTSFINAQGSTYNIGYEQKKYINASIQLSNEEFKVNYGLFSSPRVYMQVNETTALNDGDENWVLVSVENVGGGFNSKKNSQTLSVKIELPEIFTLKM